MPGPMSLFDRALSAMLPIVPRPIVRKVASKYVAGEDLEQALERIRRLQEWGACTTVDVLGEEIDDIARSVEAETAYLEVLDAIDREKLDANISIKLTAFGLRLDHEVCYRRVRRVVERARELSNFVRIDMEDSSVTTDTLDVYRRLRADGHQNCGVVLQAYMRRSEDDVRTLSGLTPSYRLCKGIYVEREEVAFQDGSEINQSFVKLLDAMFKGGSYVGIATHDHALVDAAYAMIQDRGLRPDQYEFQMLLGVDEPLGRRIMDDGHRLRVYVPFGKDWYAYCVRRLKENPRIGRYVFLAMFKR